MTGEFFKSEVKKDVVTGVLAALAVAAAIVGYISYNYGISTQSNSRSMFLPATRDVAVKAVPVIQALPSSPVDVSGNTATISLKLDKPVLVKWVMASSLRGKMYPRLAEEIVDTSMQIDNGRFTLLLLALMKRESNFYVFHKSSAGAVGLGQFMPDTIKQMVEWGWLKTPIDVYDPQQHIPAIVKFLEKKGMRRDGTNINKALFNYFGGKLNPDAAKGYIKSVKANIGDLVIALMSAHQDKPEATNGRSKSNSVGDANVSSGSVRDAKNIGKRRDNG